jgi:hypothetical protein
MSQERESCQLRLSALPFLQKIYEKNVRDPYTVAGKILNSELGISRWRGMNLFLEYADIRERNKNPGGVVQLPEMRALESNEYPNLLEVNSGLFTLSYVRQRLGMGPSNPFFDMMGLVEQGCYFLGNSEKETKSLAVWMDNNLDKVADYLDWFYVKFKYGKASIVSQFRIRAQKGDLKKVKF